MKKIIITVGILASMFLSGCANQHAVFRKNSFPASPAIITQDAKQRNIITNSIDNNLRICAEASPDVFMVLNSSGSLDANVNDAVRAKLGISISESGASIERTQTINLLRESLYRTCERYLSGAINSEQMVVQAARDQRVMLGVLAIEQLTRTVRPPSTVILGGGAASSISGALDDAMAEVDKRVQAEADAKANYDSAKAAIAKVKPLKADGLDCDAIKKDDKATKEDKDTCALAGTVDAKKVELAKATASREAAERVASSAVGGVSAGTGSPTAPSGTLAITVADSATLEKVAITVENIVKESNKIDDFLMLCINMLTRPQVNEGNELRTTCLNLVAAAGRLKVEEFDREAASIAAATNAPRERAASIAKALLGSNLVTEASVKAALEKARIFEGAPDRTAIVNAFTSRDEPGLSAAIRQSLPAAAIELENIPR
jgi:hypothetical protein